MSSKLEQRQYLKRWRETAYAALGGVCAHCGFSDWRAFQIDHVAGGGNKERAQSRSSSYSHYKRVVSQADSGKYQLLCANCNQIKRRTNKEN